MYFPWESIVVIGLIIGTFVLYSRISVLEREVETLKRILGKGGTEALKPTPYEYRSNPIPVAPQSFPSEVQSHPLYTPVSVSPSATAERGPTWYDWVKQDFLVKVGALLLLIALGWFASYAFANNWIGPVGRITLGILTGVAVLVLGSVRMNVSHSQGSIFTILGSTTIILTITAAQHLYDLFSPATALFVMTLSSVYVAFVSVQYHRSSLALSSLAMAALAPFLVDLVRFDPVLLMLYLLLIVAGTLWVVWYLQTYILVLAALGAVFIYTPIAYDLDTGVALIFSFVFTGIFFLTNLISIFRHPERSIAPAHILGALATAVYLLVSIFTAAPEEWQSIYLAVWALVFSYGSFLVFVRSEQKVAFYIYGAASLVLLGAATAIELDGAVLTIVFTIEVLASIFLMSHVAHNQKALTMSTWLLLIPGLLTLDHLDSYRWRDGIFHADMVAVLIFVAALVVAALLHFRFGEKTGELHKTTIKSLLIIAFTYLAIVLWLSLHALFTDGVATTLALISYTLIGLTAYVYGKMHDLPVTKKVGMVVLGFVVVRLLLIDIWDLDLTGRIITFFIIGVLFISTAFIPKLRTKVDEFNK